MSLKAFHIFFILTAILLCGGLGGLEIRNFFQSRGLSDLLWGLAGCLGAVILMIYLSYFISKMNKMKTP